MSEQCEENPILARARTAIENGEAVNRVSALVARIEELEAAIERAREIHQPHRCRMSTRHIDCSIMFGGECSHEGKCQVCREKYPCATVCALGGDGEPPQGPLQFYKGRSEGFTAIQTVGDAPGCPACDGVAGTECRCHLRTGCDLGTTRCHRAEAAEAVIERVRDVLDEWDDLVIDGEDPEEHIIRALDYNKGVNND